MGRSRKKGRDLSGWLIIDKPAGMTSTAVVNKVKWAFDAKKAGHAGTLDPAATGLLAVAFGEATKTIPYVTDALKAYRFTMRLGAATNTDDAEGEVIETSDMRPETAEIETALANYRGQIEQVPPQFSAVKIDGERAYKRARDGEESDLAARPLWVEALELVAHNGDDLTLDLTCGKGGYVRAIARDLGRDLGCLGHVLNLRRLWSGPFDLDDAVDLETITAEAKSPELDRFLLPLELGLQDLPEMRCSAAEVGRLANGNAVSVHGEAPEFGDTVWVSHEGQALAVGVYRAGQVQPIRVLAPRT